jgi:hypothetical protein
MGDSRKGEILAGMNEYLNSLFQIVRFGLNTNSYKFAFWRCLVQVTTDQNRTSNTVAVTICIHPLTMKKPTHSDRSKSTVSLLSQN